MITDLGQQILNTEASGVLNWMLDGLDKLRADGGQLHLTKAQQDAVDSLLLESESHVFFVRENLIRDAGQQLTVADCFAAYIEYVSERGWVALNRTKFGHIIGDVVARQHGITVRHDIPDALGKAQRGWNGIGFGKTFTQAADKNTSEVSETRFSDESDICFEVGRGKDQGDHGNGQYRAPTKAEWAAAAKHPAEWERLVMAAEREAIETEFSDSH